MRHWIFTTALWLVPVAGVLCVPLLVAPSCVRPAAQAPAITTRFEDRFDRAELGPDWYPTSGVWSIQDGHVRVANARNHPLWLRRRLPRNARIEFDAWSTHPDGDIKCEVYGDGRSYAQQVSYTATSYVIIFGGWRNSLNVIARMDEHGADRRVRQGPRVEPHRRYHWVIERRDRVLTWSIDGQPMLEFHDDEPLAGPGHEYFAFNNWMVELGFDNLVITPL